MLRTKSRAALLFAAVALTVSTMRLSHAEEPIQSKSPSQARSAKQDLSPENLAKLHTLIRPHDNEWRHLRVNWLTDVAAARKKAIAEDKPIIICYTGGAGYNEPLGVC